MFQKLTKITAAFLLLTAGYFGYVRVFALASRLLAPTHAGLVLPADPSPARTLRETLDLARRTFGEGHWTTDPQKALLYYDVEHGYWMFFERYTRQEDGKKITFTPFALIWGSKKDKALKTVTAETAEVVFDKPFDMGKADGGEPARVVFARLIDDVRMRDDKGTPGRLEDDMTIALRYIEYDEKSLQVRALESPVAIREGDVTLDGFGALIELRPPKPRPDGRPGTGFGGARRATVYKDVLITARDVGNAGLVPGTAPKAAKAAKAADKPPVPGRLKSDGPLVVDLPEPVEKGMPPNPTFAKFTRNVVISQGDPKLPDECLADALRLTLVPAKTLEPKKPRAAAKDQTKDKPSEEDEAADGALSKLTLKRAEATGHAVWLRSVGQGIVGRGNQLIYERHAPESPDTIYFRSDDRVRVEKTNLVRKGPEAGKAVESIDVLKTVDVTIFQGMAPGDSDTIVARGPGTIESRPAKDRPIERSASWRDKLIVQSVGRADKERRKITLFGDPVMTAAAQADLKARDRIVVYLKPKAKPEADKALASIAAKGPPVGDAYQIDWMEADGNVVMHTIPAPAPPGGRPDAPKTLRARQRLDVVFVEGAPAPAAEPKEDLAFLPNPDAAKPPEAEPAPNEPAKPAPPPKAPEPAIDVAADSVYAWVRLLPRPADDKADARTAESTPRAELDKAYLRRRVTIHQDPPEGKTKGTDLTAENLDLFNQGDGRFYVEAHGGPKAPAKASTEAIEMEGPVLVLDQLVDEAKIDGAGRLYRAPTLSPIRPDEVRSAARPVDGTLPVDAAAKDMPKDRMKVEGPMEVRFTRRMRFFGTPLDEKGRPLNAQAIFEGAVRARSADALVEGDVVETSFDQQVPLYRPKRSPGTPKPEKPPEPDLELFHGLGKVRILKVDVDPATKAPIGKKQINGPDVTFDKSSGDFEVKGPGVVRVTQRRGKNSLTKPGGDLAEETPRVRPVAAGPADREKVKAAVGQAAKLAPLELTRIEFDKGVTGRIDGIEGPKGSESFDADFVGPVRVLQAPVPDIRADLDMDNPPLDAYYATSDRLNVVQVPSPSGPKEPARILLKAMGNANANTAKHAIRGDVVTYDSLAQLTYVYGTEGEVSIVNQDGQGQPFTSGRGRAIRLNNRTGEKTLLEPSGFAFVDPKSTLRATAAGPAAVASTTPKRKPIRMPVRPTPRSDIERRGFNGR